MIYCGLPSAPITGRRVAVTIRVPLPGVTIMCSSRNNALPDAISLRSSASISPALTFGMTSPTVLPSMAERSTPRYFSVARLTNKYLQVRAMSLTMIGEGTFSMIISRNERVCSRSRSARLRSVISSCIATQPPPLHRMVDDGNGAAIIQFDIDRESLALLDGRAQFVAIAAGFERKRSGGDAGLEQVADAAAEPIRFGSMLYIARSARSTPPADSRHRTCTGPGSCC